MSPAEERVLTLVHTRYAFLLTKRVYATWREIQAEYFDYNTSLGPYTINELFEYLAIEYHSGIPFTRSDVEAFLADDAAVVMSGASGS